MAISKQKFLDLAELFGFHLNADAVDGDSGAPLEDQLDADLEPGDELLDDELLDEELALDNAQVARFNSRQAAPVRRQAAVRRDASEQFQNLLQLNQLIDDIGGFDAYKGLLLNAVDAVEALQHNQAQERAGLVVSIVTNSAGAFSEADLKDIDLPVLRKMADGYAAQMGQFGVDYSALGSRSVLQNAREDAIAVPPSFFLNSGAGDKE